MYHKQIVGPAGKKHLQIVLRLANDPHQLLDVSSYCAHTPLTTPSLVALILCGCKLRLIDQLYSSVSTLVAAACTRWRSRWSELCMSCAFVLALLCSAN
jgi:hypothetical protein